MIRWGLLLPPSLLKLREFPSALFPLPPSFPLSAFVLAASTSFIIRLRFCPSALAIMYPWVHLGTRVPITNVSNVCTCKLLRRRNYSPSFPRQPLTSRPMFFKSGARPNRASMVALISTMGLPSLLS